MSRWKRKSKIVRKFFYVIYVNFYRLLMIIFSLLSIKHSLKNFAVFYLQNLSLVLWALLVEKQNSFMVLGAHALWLSILHMFIYKFWSELRASSFLEWLKLHVLGDLRSHWFNRLLTWSYLQKYICLMIFYYSKW